jgi:hypothetical protein
MKGGKRPTLSFAFRLVMIRTVAFKKAIVAGTIGAFAWEASVRPLIWLGTPMFDLVRVLGTMVVSGETDAWQWWIVGMVMHALVGAIWAIFYAYFFWSMFDFPPFLQGMFFSLLPALLAGSVMIPQMDFMHALVQDGSMQKLSFFAIGIGWLGPLTVVFGHFIYGVVLGSIYTRPVGYPVGRRPVRYG